jgi:NAD(P)-dependent dehydrogenase (short-subunit alcohol dehydrogenase family)
VSACSPSSTIANNLRGVLIRTITKDSASGIFRKRRNKDDPKDFLKTFQPMGQVVEIADIVDAVLYLAQAGQVTGEVLRVDGGAHAGR